MRSLTPTLLAAQRSLGGVASVRIRVEDRELRWAAMRNEGTSVHQTAACAVTGAVLRARVTAAGTLDLQRMTNPGDPGQWQGWATLANDAVPTSDVALSPVDGDPSRVRLFYVRMGGSPYRLSWRQSSDGGLSWSAPADVLTGLAVADRSLAGANGQLFYHDPADQQLKLAVRAGWDTGGWAVSTWTGAGALSTRYGLAAGYAGGVYYLVSADQEAASQLDLPGGEPQSLPSFLQPGINLRRDERGLVITLSNDVLFTPGKAVLSPEAVKRISQAAEILRYGTQPISVEGHTDNERLPGETPFKDNYDLSLARALAVAHQLIQGDGVDANRVRVAALGASRPLAPNDTPEHRAMNRRIEIVVLLNQS